MALSRRYQTWPPGEAGNIGMDFTPIVPPGVALISGEVEIVTNTNPAHDASADWATGDLTTHARQVWMTVTGGQAGTDYQIRWTVADSRGHTWNRTALMLCAESA